MLWCRADNLQSEKDGPGADMYGHAYSIVNNFKGYDHVHIFWFCSENQKNVSLSNRVIRDFGSGTVKQTELSEKYFNLLISEADFKDLKRFLETSFSYNIDFIPETAPVCYDILSGKSNVQDYIPDGAAEWKLYREENYDLTINVTGYYDVRYSSPVADDKDKSILNEGTPMIDTLDLSALKKKE